jgi:colanic acid biosynthesis glycosyl transferase WcaI
LLADLAPMLAQEGWQMTVLTGRTTGALRSEIIDGVRLERVGALTLTRASHWRRALCYLTLHPALLWRALRLPRADVVVTMTDPPLLLLLGPLLKGMKGSRLVHWAQDIYPEIVEELGVLSKGGRLAGLCRRASTWALRRHHRVIVVGRCMKERLLQRGLSGEAICVVPNWASSVRSIEHAANPFRREHGLEGRFVVMYSGNFGWAHAFEPILEAAARLQSHRPEILFLFVGAGPRLAWIRRQVETLRIHNVHFLPPQPVEKLPKSLSAADLHLVSMQPNLCGLVVPSKLYGILAAGRPSIFLGPKESEVARTLEEYCCGSVIEASDGATLAHCLVEWAGNPERLRAAGQRATLAAKHFTSAIAARDFREILHQVTASISRAEEVPQQIPSKTTT